MPMCHTSKKTGEMVQSVHHVTQQEVELQQVLDRCHQLAVYYQHHHAVHCEWCQCPRGLQDCCQCHWLSSSMSTCYLLLSLLCSFHDWTAQSMNSHHVSVVSAAAHYQLASCLLSSSVSYQQHLNSR